MERRTFLKALTGGLTAAGTVTLGYPLVRLLAPPGEAGALESFRLPRPEIPAGGAKSVVINNVPVIVIERGKGDFVAFSRICTHLGCLVDFDEEDRSLFCPCHAGRFDLNGNVVAGPPPAPLKALPVRLERDEILIG